MWRALKTKCFASHFRLNPDSCQRLQKQLLFILNDRFRSGNKFEVTQGHIRVEIEAGANRVGRVNKLDASDLGGNPHANETRHAP